MRVMRVCVCCAQLVGLWNMENMTYLLGSFSVAVPLLFVESSDTANIALNLCVLGAASVVGVGMFALHTMRASQEAGERMK